MNPEQKEQVERIVGQVCKSLYRYYYLKQSKMMVRAEAWAAVLKVMQTGLTDDESVYLESVREASRRVHYEIYGSGRKKHASFSDVDLQGCDTPPRGKHEFFSDGYSILKMDIERIAGPEWTGIIENVASGVPIMELARASGKKISVFLREYNTVLIRLREGLKDYNDGTTTGI